jgi:glycosyltransferase involved in cell wall biosynthesis
MTRQQLRIAMMLESDGPGGAEMMVFRLAEELRRRGHVVVPVGPINGIGWLGDLFRGAGVSPEFFRIRRPLDPACVRGLVQLFREHDINAVHSHEFTMAVYGAAASRLMRLPHVITMHGGFRACSAFRRRIALRWAMRNSSHTVMVSRATQRQFATDLGLHERRFTVVPNGVPSNPGTADRVRAEFGIRPGERVLLAVGTLERHKGHRVLLEALSQLERAKDKVPWRLIIAGGRGGDQHDSLIEFAEETGLNDRVHVVTNRNDIPDLLALADIFVMPSLFEGLPMALLEAMIAGKAIVASATSGIPEAIESGREGLLVTPGDVGALARALQSLLTDEARRGTLGDAAARRAGGEFTVQVMADRYEALYASSARFRSARATSEVADIATNGNVASERLAESLAL